jgi:hypothetical protein
MVTILFGQPSGRVAPARGILRQSLARMMACCEQQARRPMNAHLLTRSDATLAIVGYDRPTMERAGRDGYPP